MARFAAGLQDDLAAIQAGLTLPWSNGVAEGHVNHLKLLKRQAYGRAHVALLRQRILQESSRTASASRRLDRQHELEWRFAS